MGDLIPITRCKHGVDLTIRDCNLCKNNDEIERLQARVEALERVRDAAAAILRIESLRKAGHQFPQLEQALKDADAEQEGVFDGAKKRAAEDLSGFSNAFTDQGENDE